MKCLIVFAIVCVVVLAQWENPTEGIHYDEVGAIIRANPSITVEECTTKCDSVYALDVPHNEEITDHDCARECRIQIQGESATSRA